MLEAARFCCSDTLRVLMRFWPGRVLKLSSPIAVTSRGDPKQEMEELARHRLIRAFPAKV
jgi:hypothetical protein